MTASIAARFAARRVQDEVRDLLRQPQRARMADADAQAQKLGLPSAAWMSFRPPVAGVPAALLEFHLAGHKVQLVMQHQHGPGREPEARQRADRLAGTVHVGVEQQQHVVRAQPGLGDHAEERLLQREGRAQIVGQVIGQQQPALCRWSL